MESKYFSFMGHFTVERIDVPEWYNSNGNAWYGYSIPWLQYERLSSIEASDGAKRVFREKKTGQRFIQEANPDGTIDWYRIVEQTGPAAVPPGCEMKVE